MFNFRLAGDHLYGKWLFTRLSMVMSLMVCYFVLSLLRQDFWIRSGTELRKLLRIFQPTLPSKSMQCISKNSSPIYYDQDTAIDL